MIIKDVSTSPLSTRISPTHHLLLSLGQIFKETLGMPGGSEEQQRAKLLAHSEDTAASMQRGRSSPAASGT